MTIREKFQQLEKGLKAQFVERDDVVNGLVVAALAGEHVLLLGPPGTAKSALASAFCRSVKGANYFEWLLSKFTAPEELFGPVSLSALKSDTYRRVTAGKLPESEIVFLDEIFKANSAILNSLLTAINERKFHNGGSSSSIPLRLVIGASNEFPEGPELGALYDRFMVRFWVDYVRGPGEFLQLIRGDLQESTQQITMGEWDQAIAEVDAVVFGNDAASMLLRLRNKLDTPVSDRRWVKCVRLLKAAAWLAGHSHVEEEAFMFLSSVLWSDSEESREAAEKTINELVDGQVSKLTAQVKVMNDLVSRFPRDPGSDPDAWQQRGISLMKDASALIRELEKAHAEQGDGNTRKAERIRRLLDEVQAAIRPVKAATMESFGI